MKDRFLQFPISALSWDPVKNWRTILDLACHHCGLRMIAKHGEQACFIKARQWLARHSKVQADIAGCRDQFALVIGYDTIDIGGIEGDLFSRMKDVQVLRAHCNHHPVPIVRIRTDIWWKTFTPDRFKAPISAREFVVLAAVYAAIGNKSFAKASLQMLRRYAAGHPKEEEFQAAHRTGASGSCILSIHQIRYTLDSLEANGFFVKFTYNRGECFYSIRLNRDVVRQSVANRKMRKLETLAVFRSLDKLTSEEIHERKDLALNPLEKGS